MRVLCRTITFVGLMLVGTISFPPAIIRGAAANDDAGPLLAAVRSAVADGRLDQTRELGFTLGKKQFREAPDDGGFLTGLDIGLGKFLNIENIYAVRANYWTQQGDVRLQEHGLFRDKRPPNGKVVKTKVLRTVHIKAPPGYAVGGLTIRSGLNINGLSVTFMKIDGAVLDPAQSLESDWVGDRTGGGESSLDGKGAPVASLFGSQDEEKVTALGLIFGTAPAAAAAPVAVHPVEPPPNPPLVMPPPLRPVERPRRDINAGFQAVIQELQRDADDADPTETASETVAPPAAEGWPLWATAGIPAVVFIVVAGVCLLAVLVPFGRQAPQARSAAKRPAGARRKLSASHKQEVIELCAEDILPALPADEPILEPVLIRRAVAADLRPAGSWPRMEV